MQLNLLKDYFRKYEAFLGSPDAQQRLFIWEAQLNWLENWDPAAGDFAAMYDRCLSSSKTNRLWYREAHEPKKRMLEFIDLQEDMVRQAFEDLFNEQRALDGRVDRFVFYCDELLAAYREAYPHRPVNNHYHSDDYGMISLYLAFRYPAQYTLYDPVIFRTLLQQLGVQNLPQSNDIVRYFKVANTIYKLMQKEAKLLPLHRQRLQEGTHYLGDSLLVVYDFACMVTGLQGAAYDKK